MFTEKEIMSTSRKSIRNIVQQKYYEGTWIPRMLLQNHIYLFLDHWDFLGPKKSTSYIAPSYLTHDMQRNI